MTTFTVSRLSDPAGAEPAVSVLENAEREDLVEVLDHAVVSWPSAPKGRPASTRTTASGAARQCRVRHGAHSGRTSPDAV
jgi:hypothetical protein